MQTDQREIFIPDPGDIEARGIYLGCPVLLLTDGGCTPANWFSDLVLRVLLPIAGFNGAVMIYQGSYWPALWRWLFGDQESW